MSTKFLSPGWRMPRNANQSKSSNYSMDFDGGAYINIGTSDVLNFTPRVDAFSVSVWVKKVGSGNLSGTIYSYNADSGPRQIQFTYDESSQTLYAIIGGSSSTASANLTDGNWHHVVFVIPAATTGVLFYHNGSLITTASSSIGTSTGTVGGNIGSRTNGSFNFSNGRIDGLAIFNYELSSSQITTLYGDSTNGPGNPMALPSPPKAYYPLGTSAWNGQYLAENNAIGDYVFDFNGINNYITIPDSSDLEPQNLTVSFWINAGVQDTYDYYLEKGNGSYAVYTGATTTDLIFFIYDGSYYLSNALTNALDSSWHHIVFTYDGSQIIGYKDGVANTPVSASATILYDANPLRLFSKGNTLGNYPSGKMSNAQIFNTALSSTDIETLYNYGSPIRTLANIPQSSNLKAWYKLDASEVYNSTTTEWEVYNNAGYEKTYSFNGSNNIQIPNDSSIQPTNWTIGFWVKGFGQNGTYLFNNSPNGWNIKSSGNDIIISVGTSQSTAHRTATNALNGKWNYIVFSYDGANVRGSLNGGYLGYNGAYGQTYDSSNLFIGSYSDGTNGFVGEIGQILFWNTRKNNSEGWNSTTQKPITSLPTPQSSNNNNLVSWWKLDTAIITDSFGSNTGINNGAILSNTIIGRPAVIGDGDSSGMSQSNLVQSDLQRVAPYSKYAMNFDGANDEITFSSNVNLSNSWSVGFWFKTSSINNMSPFFGVGDNNEGVWSFFRYFTISYLSSSKFSTKLWSNGTGSIVALTPNVNDGLWHNLVITYNYSQSLYKVYLDGSECFSGNYDTSTGNSISKIGTSEANWHWDGLLSNVSIWNTSLTSSQANEIYNEGLPSNLNNHSAYSNLTNWWQLGENSSFTNNWICADEKGTNNGESNGMGVGALVNGVGTTANGISSGMSEGNLVGDAPYSTANAISSGMAVTARGTDVP